jgi:hypothetical protein
MRWRYTLIEHQHRAIGLTDSSTKNHSYLVGEDNSAAGRQVSRSIRNKYRRFNRMSHADVCGTGRGHDPLPGWWRICFAVIEYAFHGKG